jgi:Zn finger protein HypA/HybF involved in hydrogenase expression
MTTSTVDVYCVTCGEDGQANAETGRCVKCNRQTIRTTHETLAVGQQILRGNGTAPVAASPPKALKLSNTPALERWVDQTRTLAEAFTKAAAEASKRASTASAEAERLGKAATAFRLLLTQVELESASEQTTRPGRNLTHGRWARAHDCCTRCGTTERRHKANGLCTGCHSRKGRS